jgi:DNA-binding NtrC family response regulator
MVARGKFRQDLYYRLNVIELRIPPLRDRIEDLPLLIRHFIDEFRTNFGSFVQDISEEALECLMAYSWPGNVRELRNCIERIMNLSANEVIEIGDIPVLIRKRGDHEPTSDRGAQPRAIHGEHAPASPGLWSGLEGETKETRKDGSSPLLPHSVYLKGSTQAAERATILHALEKAGYNRQRAARMLGISSTTLWRKMKAIASRDEAAGEV